jgi:hypothetical protein
VAIRLIDLRRAAVREYPELRPPPEPDPLTWWQRNAWRVTIIAVWSFDVILIVAVTITQT